MKMGFLSFFFPKNRKRIEKNLNPNPLFLVRYMILALDKLLPSIAYLYPHMNNTNVHIKTEKYKIISKINFEKSKPYLGKDITSRDLAPQRLN